MACSYADHFVGLGRRFRICGGTSRIRGMITPGAVSNAEIKIDVSLITFTQRKAVQSTYPLPFPSHPYLTSPALVTLYQNFCMSQAAVGQRSAQRPQWRQTSSSFAMMRPVLRPSAT